jgi:2-haloacid dehalogenase
MISVFDFTRFQAITFDCYGTLIDWETGILTAIRQILSRHKAESSDVEILRLYSEFEAEAESGEFVPYREVLCRVVRDFGARLGFRPTPDEQQSLANSVADWTPFPDTVPALQRLKTKFKLGIISNVDDELFSQTARRLEVNFDYVITAGQARAYKPSKTIFNLAQTRMGVAAENWLHAGQSLYHDMIPAKSLGISTAWVNRPSIRAGSGAAKQALAEPDFQVARLRELVDLVTSTH